MSDSDLLLLVLAGLYLYECLTWIRRDVTPFRALWGARWRIVNPDYIFGNARGGLLIRNPLPPLGRATLTQPWPLSISPIGVASFVSTAFNPGRRPPQQEQFLTFDAITKVAAAGNTIFVNGAELASACSPRATRRLVELIESLRSMPEACRTAAIDNAIAESLSHSQAAARAKECATCCRALAAPCNALLLYVFVALPVIISEYGLAGNWPLLVVILVVLVAAIAILYARGHRRLHPASTSERRTRLALMLLTPLSAIRAMDALWLDAVSSFHPLAVSRALSPEAHYQRFAGAIWRDLRNPIPFALANDALAACEMWYRERLLSAMRRVMDAEGLSPDILEQPQVRDDPNNLAYCPRCLSQFVLPHGACQACGGLTLRQFAATSPQPIMIERENCTT